MIGNLGVWSKLGQQFRELLHNLKNKLFWLPVAYAGGREGNPPPTQTKKRKGKGKKKKGTGKKDR